MKTPPMQLQQTRGDLASNSTTTHTSIAFKLLPKKQFLFSSFCPATHWTENFDGHVAKDIEATCQHSWNEEPHPQVKLFCETAVGSLGLRWCPYKWSKING